MAIEGDEDAGLVKKWLLANPFKNPVALTVLSVVPSFEMVDPANMVQFQAWIDSAMQYAEDLVKETGAGTHERPLQSQHSGCHGSAGLDDCGARDRRWIW